MLGDSSVVLKTETVCSVSLGVFHTGTVGSYFSDGRTDGHEGNKALLWNAPSKWTGCDLVSKYFAMTFTAYKMQA